MAKRILTVGHCGYDHGNIAAVLQKHFDAAVDRVDSATEAVTSLQQAHYDLVLVNRVFDANGDSGLKLINRLKADSTLKNTPVMLISNYPDAQADAQAAGALPGFGKKQIGKSQLVEHFKQFLVGESGTISLVDNP
jgi:two-component system chemotaxis response regulator CheY